MGVGGAGAVVSELLQFLGKVVGLAVRHGVQLGLELPSLVWRPLVGLPLTVRHLEAVDKGAALALRRMAKTFGKQAKQSGDGADGAGAAASFAGAGQEEQGQHGHEGGEGGEGEEEEEPISCVTHLSDGAIAPLWAGASDVRVTRANWSLVRQLALRYRLRESAAGLAALRDGLASVLPVEALLLFTPAELEQLVCGKREVDIDLLQQCTEYEDVNESSAHIRYFWEVLREMGNDDRVAFLRFVWSRSRMPLSAKDFPLKFRIQAAQGQARERPDEYLPHAQTCFFSLSLPEYTSKAVLRQKLQLAIRNTPTMDADVLLHNADGWADS
jgi:hypothetical protein